MIPSPPEAYYTLTEVDLSQRIILIDLFKLFGIDMYSLPGGFFNALLKPKDSNLERLHEVLVEEKYANVENVIKVFK